MFSHDQIEVTGFGKSSEVHPVWVCMTLICPSTDDLSSVSFLRWCPPRFSTVNVLCLPLILINTLREIFRVGKYLFKKYMYFLKFSFFNFSIHRGILNATIITVVLDKWSFAVPLILSTFINWNFDLEDLIPKQECKTSH